MVSNGSVGYDHGKDGRSAELGGCAAEIRNKDHETYLAIRYSKGRLTVSGPPPSDRAPPEHTQPFAWIRCLLLTKTTHN